MTQSRTAGAVTTKCKRCGTRIITQLVGRVAALPVTANAEPIRPDQEPALTNDNRLAWCLITGPWQTTQLRWRCTSRRCKHHIVTDHQCTPQPTTLF